MTLIAPYKSVTESAVKGVLYALILTLVILWAVPASASDTLYRVIRVVDGDTIVVDFQGKPEKVRLLCVNTPESVHPDQKQNIPMGKVASNFTKTKISGKHVGLEFEGTRIRGKYGRLLAYVILDGQNFNLELVKQGLSPYYTKYGRSQKYDGEFKEGERFAQKNQLNIWGDPVLTKHYLKLKKKSGFYIKGSTPPESLEKGGMTYKPIPGPRIIKRRDFTGGMDVVK